MALPGLGYAAEARQPAIIMPHYCIQQIGAKARDELRMLEHGNVLAVFKGIAYLVTQSGALLWLGDETLPMHTRCLRMQGSLPRVQPGQSLRVRGDHVEIGSTASLEIGSAVLWNSPRPSGRGRIDLEQVPDRARRWGKVALAANRPSGFAGWIATHLEQPDGASASILRSNDPVMNVAGPILDGIVQACTQGDWQLMLARSADLIGLGEGLTPSGDDFVGGLLFSHAHLRAWYPAIPGLPALEQFLRTAERCTNLISFTLLKDLADGMAAEPAHHWCNVLLSGGDRRHAASWLEALIHIGHSTGWDLFAGMLLGLLHFPYHAVTYPSDTEVAAHSWGGPA